MNYLAVFFVTLITKFIKDNSKKLNKKARRDYEDAFYNDNFKRDCGKIYEQACAAQVRKKDI
jgi:hypothetical protein